MAKWKTDMNEEQEFMSHLWAPYKNKISYSIFSQLQESLALLHASKRQNVQSVISDSALCISHMFL